MSLDRLGARFLNEEDRYDPETCVTDLECACCNQEIEPDDEVSFLQIVQAQKVGDHIEFYPVLKDSDGDFQFTPLFVHLNGCWKDVQEGIEEAIEDVPPIEDAFSLLKCEYCKSGVREWEYMAVGYYGEFYCSPRKPNGSSKQIYTFGAWTGANLTEIKICLACIARISEETLDDWDEVSQLGECVFCTHARCWRDSSCSCFCHHEE